MSNRSFATVVGIQTVDYVNKAGQQVSGVRLHITHPGNKYVDGLMAENVYVSRVMFEENTPIKVGDQVYLFYNRYGSVDGWEVK